MVLGQVERFLSVGLIQLPETVGPELRFSTLMLVPLVEHGMQDFLCLDIAQQVLNPQLICGFLIRFVIIFRDWHEDDLFEGVVQMFLIIMEW